MYTILVILINKVGLNYSHEPQLCKRECSSAKWSAGPSVNGQRHDNLLCVYKLVPQSMFIDQLFIQLNIYDHNLLSDKIT